MANDIEINIVAALRNDGIVTLVESNGKKTSEYLPFEYLQYTNEVHKEMIGYTGYINEKELEIRLRNKAMEEFSKEGMYVYGNDT